MHRYIAFLRGINLGRRRLPMSRLKTHFQELGFAQVETFIASGNVLFTSPQTKRRQLEAGIARHLQKSLGYAVDTFVRSAEEVAAIARRKIFPDANNEGISIHVGFMQEKLAPGVARKFAALHTAEDEFRVRGQEYYLVVPRPHFRIQGLDLAGDGAAFAELVDAQHDEHSQAGREAFE